MSARKKNWELYNLAKDPLELNDLSKKHPEKLRELEVIWRSESRRHANQAELK